MNFYPKLALTNVKKNKRLFSPYLLTSIMMIALYYIIDSLCYSQAVENHETLSTFLTLGAYVIIFFAVIFLFYANSFVIKNRKKELSLYNILGMEKRHIMLMMFFEVLMTSCLSIFIGIVFGILMEQVMQLVILNMMHDSISFTLNVPMNSLINTILFFSGIFFLSLVFNLMNIQLSNPIELLNSKSAGEKEPKTKILMTIIGLICLGTGYYLAITIDDPMVAIALFFVAVILVVIGTYLLFTAGSIALLKALKKNRHYYYQTRHFTSISGLIYRMKQNAVGLGNICILCTCILVTLSSTVCLYQGIEDTVELQCPVDYACSVVHYQYKDYLNKQFKKYVSNIKYTDYYELAASQATAILDKTQLKLDPTSSSNYKDVSTLNCLTQTSYNHAFHKNISLKSNEIYLYTSFDYPYQTMRLGNQTYRIKGTFHDRRVMSGNAYATKQMAIVFNDHTFHTTSSLKERPLYYWIGFNSKDPQLKRAIINLTNHLNVSFSSFNKEETRANGYELFGGFLFIGIFLSIMFLMSAIVIIYNKQLSEGFEDQNKFEILQNVGMSKKEVKQAIKSQVLIFFFLPLIVAVIHLCFAYPLILNILSALLMGSESSYFFVTAGCVLGLVIIYSIVYIFTSRTYYSIVKK